MAKRTVKQQADDFCKNNPKASFLLEDMNEIMELDSAFDRVLTAFYFGYLKGQKVKKQNGMKVKSK